MKQLPLTVTRSIELLGLCLLIALFSVANSIIMPLLMAFFISLMLLPLFRFLRKIKIPELIAIVLVILTAALIIIAILAFFSLQIASLVKDFPQLEKNLNLHWTTLSNWINRNLNLSADQQIKVLQEQGGKLLNNAGSYLSGAAVSITGVFVFMGLLPIYIFLILFYKNLLLRFIFLWFNRDDHPQVESALRETEVMVKSYLMGLVIQVTYMTVLLGGILMIIGIKHAMLIAIIFAILNLIPYVGALIGNVIGVLLTLTSSSELWHIFAVLIVITVVQFLDNNILMPRIVGSKVKINALVSIIGVIIGGTLAGVSGMFLSLPMIAILKIIFDHTTDFRHWGILLGDERPGLSPMTNPAVRLRNRHVRKPDTEEEKED
ncbi:AI-2E family transporter [Agriterribacter sp.]|mgnify:CR=1 FL=1|uniref:AI-2E family transporter n=1 Tax=Agriterribacter sp. TaxID=2821509 RepID=UPI002C8A8910|nr:AI-2E family transporter [Agriterribacter sp.]HRO44223.1 AI-2E family transporter [Agriterribacter sp.]HRQ18844.1 AI-2E family transporter [Agriterribacter sp.]